MAHAHDYTVVGAQERFAKRKIVHLDASRPEKRPSDENRLIIPFGGLNGQQLAGTGALVWEGELLK